MSIKIVSGWSNPGGSTIAHINLCNALNEKGIDCTYYGPHIWHMDKCKAQQMNTLAFSPDDTLIMHYLKLRSRPPARKIILSCHEKSPFIVNETPKYWDLAHFLNEQQREFQNYQHPYVIIPNLKIPLKRKTDEENAKLDKIAGIIGSIDKNKKTHISIQKALDDGCEKVLLFGLIMEGQYYADKIDPYVRENEKVEYVGFTEDRQRIYNTVGRVYLSSKEEVSSLVQDECETTNTKFIGGEGIVSTPSRHSNEEIINKWIEVLR